jgi:diaminohydroxyphosphoribosylaminopyrimidine deaminase/5-amino-6-(5-phosphoribosylamino)uracil reductase
VVFDHSARLPLDSQLVATAAEIPVVVVTRGEKSRDARALAAKGVQVVEASNTGDALRALRDLGLRSMLVEGGAGLAGSLLESGSVDRLIIFRAPVLLGSGALGAFAHAPTWSLDDAPRLRVVRQRRFGKDEMTIYAVR